MNVFVTAKQSTLPKARGTINLLSFSARARVGVLSAALISGCASISGPVAPGDNNGMCQGAHNPEPDSDGKLFFSRAAACQSETKPFMFIDEFERENAQSLGPGWVDCKSVQPESYEPLGIYDGAAAIGGVDTRSGVYDTTPPSGHPPTQNRLFPGIGCAFVDTGSTRVSVKIMWSGNHGLGTSAPDGIHKLGHAIGDGPVEHVEATPLLYINPDHSRFGFGAWTAQLYGNAVFLMGYIGSPAEKFEVSASAVLGDHDHGVPREIELRADEPGKVTLWLDGEQLSIEPGGFEPFAIDPELIESTLHGIAIDAHFVDPRERMLSIEGIEAVKIRELDIPQSNSKNNKK